MSRWSTKYAYDCEVLEGVVRRNDNGHTELTPRMCSRELNRLYNELEKLKKEKKNAT